MYEISSPVGVLPSPSLQPHSPSLQPYSPSLQPQSTSLQTHSPSPPPDWPLPRSAPRSTHSRNRSPPRSPRSYTRSPPRSPTSGNFMLSPESAGGSVNARSSPVSDVSSRTPTDQQSHRLSPRSPMRMLPYGMIDRFDEDDDDDLHHEPAAYHESSYRHVEEEPGRPPDGRPGQENLRHRWSPLPPEEYR